MCSLPMDVFVFDLDFTLWNAGDTWCSETEPPYIWEKGKLFDQSGRWIRLYPDVTVILKTLRENGKIVAVASRTFEPQYANDLLKIFGIDEYFDIKEIYPGGKTTHISQILGKVKSPPGKVIFFDDEERNIEETKPLGIYVVKVDDGINMGVVRKFLD